MSEREEDLNADVGIDADVDDIDIDVDDTQNNEEEQEELDDADITTDQIIAPTLLNKNTIKTIKIVKKEDRITCNRISKIEYARVVSDRAQQIENGNPIFVNYKNLASPKEIAELEIAEKKSPMMIHREIGKNNAGKIVEEWSVNELIIPENL
jgi:DNA-directed RNA polymerase subunit K/omega